MKSKFFAVSVLALGLNAVGSAVANDVTPYPADAEASFDLLALETRADRMARLGDASDTWGVSRRVVQPHDPFPFGGGYIDD